VASFSFSAGNAGKLLRIPLYVAGRVATLVVPRSDDEWVFGCGAGIGDGALALWHVAAAGGHPAVWLTGSAQEATDAAALGIPSAPKHSIRGFWRTARARVIVVTHGFGDANRYAVTGAFVVQLWHGIPLKRIGLDSPATVRSGILPSSTVVRRLLAWMYRSAAQRIDVLPAASHLVRGRLESAFGISDAQVPVTGEPRVDVLSQGRPDERRARARSAIADLVGDIGDARVVLYAPTWRDGAPDPAVPVEDEWRALVAALEARDVVLLVRSHPLGAGEYDVPFETDRVRSLGSALVRDVTPLLSGMDVLVTDYSSLVFDTALVPMPVVFLAPDLGAYRRERGFYGRYEDVACDDVASTWAEATAQLTAVLDDPDERERRLARARELDTQVHAYADGRNTIRVYRAILTGLATHTAVPTAVAIVPIAEGAS
jgi:CDP-glycerol glycerophosphotransferase (TagB/SpsB family)